MVVPEQFARAWEPAFRLLENLYHRNAVVCGLRFPRPFMTRRPFLRRMFPNVAETRWRSALLFGQIRAVHLQLRKATARPRGRAGAVARTAPEQQPA